MYVLLLVDVKKFLVFFIDFCADAGVIGAIKASLVAVTNAELAAAGLNPEVTTDMIKLVCKAPESEDEVDLLFLMHGVIMLKG